MLYNKQHRNNLNPNTDNPRSSWDSITVFLLGMLLVCHASGTQVTMRTIDETWPEPPGEESWTFVEDLKKPLPFVLFWQPDATPGEGELDLRAGLSIKRDFPDEKGVLESAYADLENFIKFAGLSGNSTLPITTTKITTDVFEAYTIKITTSGIELSANDSEGIRRAIFHLEEIIATANGPFLATGSIAKKPWLKNRISRCFFGPIKRPPLNRDELLDDVDYYPDAYLNRLAHEGINGLWLSVDWKDVTQTSFREPDPQMEQRLEKLRKTVKKCSEYGIKIWIYSNEPVGFFSEDDPMRKAHPEMVGGGWGRRRYVCPNSEAGQQFIYESTRSIFSRVPGLGGMINISVGEGGSSCLDSVGTARSAMPNCERCSKVPHWQTLAAGQSAMVRGVKAGNPEAEYICWLYMPGWKPFAPWVYELAAHIPKDVIMQVNYESGGVKYQLNRPRVGGDYWLSYIGPSERFAQLAGRAAANQTRISAKLQVGCSHESATIPFMPVPQLLYNKYKQMPALNVSTVMQCWYFGNYPGLMNRAAGRLAFEDFTGSEDDFLLSLATVEWGKQHAQRVVQAWNHFATGFQHFPLSTRFQWWGPMHAAPVWPLHLKPVLKPLQPTWLVGGPCGDAVGEVMDNHTLDEAVILSRQMAETWNQGVAIMQELLPAFQDNHERLLDIGLAEAIGIQFDSAWNMLEFYLKRKGLFDLPPSQALQALQAMEELIHKEIRNSERLTELCRADSRLGFHSEAERHQYSETRLQWRIATLKDLLATEFVEYRTAFQNNQQLSPFAENRTIYTCGSGWAECDTYRWQAEAEQGGVTLKVEMKDVNAKGAFLIYLCDKFATAHYWEIALTSAGGVSNSRETALKTKPYQSDTGAQGVVLHLPASALHAYDPTGSAYAFNIFNSSLGKDNWPTGMDESDLIKSRLALSRFKPQKMGYIQILRP